MKTQDKKVFWIEGKNMRCVFVIEGEKATITTISLNSGRILDVEKESKKMAREMFAELLVQGWERTR